MFTNPMSFHLIFFASNFRKGTYCSGYILVVVKIQRIESRLMQLSVGFRSTLCENRTPVLLAKIIMVLVATTTEDNNYSAYDSNIK